jgi:hypothetical protein
MKLREFVTEEQIALNFKGRESLPVWDEDLTEEDVVKLRDESHMARIDAEHRELQALFTARYGSSKYRPSDLAKAAGIPELHAYAWLALRGRQGKGMY